MNLNDDLFLIRDDNEAVKLWLEKHLLKRERHVHQALKTYNREEGKWYRKEAFTFKDYLDYIFYSKRVQLDFALLEDRQIDAIQEIVMRYGLDIMLTATDLMMEDNPDYIDDLTNLYRYVSKSYSELSKDNYRAPLLAKDGKLVR